MKLRRRRIWKNAPRHSAVELKEEATMADPIKTLSATLREREEEREASSLFAKKKNIKFIFDSAFNSADWFGSFRIYTTRVFNSSQFSLVSWLSPFLKFN